VIRNLFLGDLGDISNQVIRTREVRKIGFLRVSIPLAGKNALSSNFFKGRAYATNSREKINEREVSE
jgi:hypothetical protein